MNSTPPPLSGVTVVDFSELLPGPFFTQCLADLGAKVTKIERPPHGDNARRLAPGLFDAINRGKNSLLIDLKDEQQRAKVFALFGTADVLVETYRPGVMKRFGLDAQTLCEAFPQLIYVSLSGYGQAGPYAHLPGHDINYLATSGALAVSGPVAGAPEQSFGLPVADLCGAMYALTSTLAALHQRQTTKRGQHLDVALADCAAHWMNPRLGMYASDALDTTEAQREATLVKVAYGAFLCSDGRYVSVAALEDHFWLRLTQAVDMSPFDSTAYLAYAARKAKAHEINAALARALSTIDSKTIFQLLVKHDVPVAPVVDPGELPQHPQFIARKLFDASAITALARFPVLMAGMNAGVSEGSPSLEEMK